MVRTLNINVKLNIYRLTPIIISTGAFHCDEALACYMLKQIDEYKDAGTIL